MRTAAKFRVVSRALTPAQAIDLAYLFGVLLRFERLVEACDGDREQALGVWRMIGREELNA